MTCACIIELIDMCDTAMTARQGSCQVEANTVDRFVSRLPACRLMHIKPGINVNVVCIAWCTNNSSYGI